MTLPRERNWAVKNTRKFLMDLQNPKATPRIPKEIRRRAWSCLKHFPSEYHMEKAQEQAPEVFGEYVEVDNEALDDAIDRAFGHGKYRQDKPNED